MGQSCGERAGRMTENEAMREIEELGAVVCFFGVGGNGRKDRANGCRIVGNAQ